MICFGLGHGRFQIIFEPSDDQAGIESFSTKSCWECIGPVGHSEAKRNFIPSNRYHLSNKI